MIKLRTALVVLIVGGIFTLLKFTIDFPNTDIQVVGIVLTIASILFGFLAGFFITELWSRYTHIRELQGLRMSETMNMITSAKYFYANNDFKEALTEKIEKAHIADVLIMIHEGDFEIPYFAEIADTFKMVEIKDMKDQAYFESMMASYEKLIESVTKLDTLYRERLFPLEWFIIVVLSLVVSGSVLFLNSEHVAITSIVILLPVVTALAIVLMRDLDTMNWQKNMITLEPNARAFDAIGVERFYKKADMRFVEGVNEFRTEEDLKGEAKTVYDEYRKYADR